jgi:hypothetical protein
MADNMQPNIPKPFSPIIDLESSSENELYRHRRKASSEDSLVSQARVPFAMTGQVQENNANSDPNHEHDAYGQHDHDESIWRDEWDDGAHLHYWPNGSTENIALFQDESTSAHNIEITAASGEPKTPHRIPKSNESESPAKSIKHNTKRVNKIRGNEEEHPPTEINDEHWEAKMKAKITENEALHLRILRYEV